MTTLDLLERLVAFPTVSADSNLALIDFVQDYLTARGFQVRRIPDATGQRAGRAHGRGTTDMKGFLAAMLTLADRASGVALKEALKLAFSWDEELDLSQLAACDAMLARLLQELAQ